MCIRDSVFVEEVFKLDIDRFRMADEHRHAHAGRGDFDVLVEDFLGLGDHFPFFFGRAIVQENVDMRDHVEGDLLGEFHRRLVVGGVVDRLGLIPQLVNALFASTRYGLIGRNDHPLDARTVMQLSLIRI